MHQTTQTGGTFWETFRGSFPVKATAFALVLTLLTIFVGRSFILNHALHELNYDSSPSASSAKPATPAENLHTTAIALRELLEAQRTRNLSPAQVDRAAVTRAQLSDRIDELKRQFAADRVKLTMLDATAGVRRLGAIERETTRLTASLKSKLELIPEDGTRAAVVASDAIKALSALSPKKPPQRLSTDLSFGLNNAMPRPASLSAGIAAAYTTPGPTTAPSDLPRTPEPADLEPAPETTVTAKVENLAASLGNDPVRIYEWVRNNVEFEPYLGVRKGADQTLTERSGSAADQSALLISLLHSAGVHARFVQGVAEIPAATAANWLGVDMAHGERLDAAAEILWSGGIPTSVVRANGQPSKVRFSHVWAEAFVPTEAYRGANENLGGDKGWLPLDPAITQTHFVQPVADLKATLSPLADNWAQQFLVDSQSTGDYKFLAPPSTDTAVRTTQLLEQSRDEMAEHGVNTESRLSELFGSREIKRSEIGFLPSTTPFRALTVTSESRSLAPELHANVRIEVSGSDAAALPGPDDGEGASAGFSYTSSTADLAGKRVTVAYVPASDVDAEVIDAYHGLLNAPSYAASLIPVLRVDGQVVARGATAVPAGYTQNFRITYKSPGQSVDVVENPILVGGLSALTLDLGRKSADQIETKANALAAIGSGTTASNVLTDAKTGRLLDLLGDLYFLKGDALAKVDSAVSGVRVQRQLSGSITALDVGVSYVSSFPIATRLDGLNIDVDRDNVSAVNTGTEQRTLDIYAQNRGFQASASESWVFETILGHDAASTARVFQAATDERVPFYQLTEANVDTRIGELDLPAEAKSEVSEAAHRGFTVIVPQRSVSIDGWQGSGYLISSEDGSLDFRITGGLSGGAVNLTFGQPNETAAGVIADGIATVSGGFVETIVDVAEDLSALFDWAKACFDALDDTVALAALLMYFAYITAFWAANAVMVGAGILAIAAAPVALVVFLVVAILILDQLIKQNENFSACAEPPDFED